MTSLRLTVIALAVVMVLRGQSLERAEALWHADRYEEANDAFRALTAAHPENADYRVAWGRFFLDRSKLQDADDLFNEALKIRKNHAGALLGLALVAADGFESRAAKLAQAALEADPKLFEAQELLARLALEDNDPARAAAEADKALALSPAALDAMALHATIDWLADQPETPWIGRILARDPHYGKAYALAGYFFVVNRRYEEGIGFYRKAIELDPKLWRARSQLGVNLMRLGEEAEARKQLEMCYANGQRDPATVNTLRLMDSYRNFETFKSGNIILRLHKKEADLLRPYFEAEMQRAVATYDKEFGFRLERPVQVEVYPDHEDFAVRTLGMPGLGALGVTFGYVVAMDSPSGRKPGTFHWASTLWHELDHVYVLAATKHRVPRWFTEGMAVSEETAVSPEWGDRLGPHEIAAIREKTLLPVVQLDRGFIHPTSPLQIGTSYFQAGRICDFIKREWGFGKLLAMMRDFAGNQDTATVIKRELGIEPEEFDKRFLAALEASTRKTVDGFDEWKKGIKQLAELAMAGRQEDVIRQGPTLRDLYPDYVEEGSVYEMLANAYLARDNKPAATGELERYAKAGGRDPDLLKRAAALLVEEKRPREAALMLNRINYINPLDDDLHRRLGELWLELGNVDGAIREFRAVLARTPLDPAAAHFNLAKAYRAASRSDAAKDELVLALEAAPGYRPAQKMLLELSP